MWSKPFRAAIDAFLSEVDRRAAGDASRYIRSGIDDLDDRIGGGFKPGEVYLLGAPTGGGKTTIMQNFALKVARGDERTPSRRVLVVSPEMTMEELGKRAVVQSVGREFNLWRDLAAGEQWVVDAMKLAALPIVFADKVDITMPEVVIEAERLAREPEGLGLVIVDYAQQVVDEEDVKRPRYLAVGDVIEYAVKIAKTLDIPVLVASQVNVVQEKKGDTVRREYRFRESEKLAHKASVVLIFDRRAPWDPDTGPEEDDPVEARVMCLKNRLGPQFKRVEVLWDKALYRVRPGPWLDSPPPAQADPRDDPGGRLLPFGAPPGDLPASVGQESLDAARVYEEASE